jgi:Fe2+ transport system protein FeoA
MPTTPLATPALAPSLTRPLTSLKPGEIGVIRETRLDQDDAALLRAMGLCLNATVRIFRIGEPCVVAVGGVSAHCKCGGMCRVGLARPLADRIFVEVKPAIAT